jgi:hypothetical protein
VYRNSRQGASVERIRRLHVARLTPSDAPLFLRETFPRLSSRYGVACAAPLALVGLLGGAFAYPVTARAHEKWFVDASPHPTTWATVLQPLDAGGVAAEKFANDVRSAFRDVRRARRSCSSVSV